MSGRPSTLIAALLLGMVSGPAPMAAADAVVLNANRYDVLAGRYSVFAKFQANLQRVLDDCGKPAPAVVPRGAQPSGRIGRETRQGIRRALDCEALKLVPATSPAREGVLTEAVWRAVMGAEPLPTVKDRADALVLAFEATDFGDPPEWNLCQDNKRAAPRQSNRSAPDFVCYNMSDPCSLLTWGPRGATAGSGREIQFVLWMVWKENPALVEKAFGSEAGNLARFFRLKGADSKGCHGATPLKRFLCAIWIDPSRSRRWEDALAELGHVTLVRGPTPGCMRFASSMGTSCGPSSSSGGSWGSPPTRSTMPSSWIGSPTLEARRMAGGRYGRNIEGMHARGAQGRQRPWGRPALSGAPTAARNATRIPPGPRCRLLSRCLSARRLEREGDQDLGQLCPAERHPYLRPFRGETRGPQRGCAVAGIPWLGFAATGSTDLAAVDQEPVPQPCSRPCPANRRNEWAGVTGCPAASALHPTASACPSRACGL